MSNFKFLRSHNFWSVLIALLALTISAFTAYFQFFQEKYDLRATIASGQSSEEQISYDIAFINSGNKNVIVTDISRFAGVDTDERTFTSFYEHPYLPTNIDMFVLRSGEIIIKKVTFPLTIPKNIIDKIKEVPTITKFGVVILAQDMDGNTYRRDYVIPEAIDLASKTVFAGGPEAPKILQIIP